MRLLSTIVLVACAFVATTVSATAQGKPVQLALFSPVQIVPENESIAGFRLSLIYGRNTNITGIDLGLVTSTTGSFTGVQWGGVGSVDRNFEGWQNNFVSITGGSFTGLQTGLYSSAGHVTGLQFSLINSAGSMKGIQIGLLNFIKQEGGHALFPDRELGRPLISFALSEPQQSSLFLPEDDRPNGCILGRGHNDICQCRIPICHICGNNFQTVHSRRKIPEPEIPGRVCEGG